MTARFVKVYRVPATKYNPDKTNGEKPHRINFL